MLLISILGFLIGLCITLISLAAKDVYDFDTEYKKELQQKAQSEAPTHITGIGEVKIQNQTSIYNFANATTITLMMREAKREANRGVYIDTKIIENSLKQGREVNHD